MVCSASRANDARPSLHLNFVEIGVPAHPTTILQRQIRELNHQGCLEPQTHRSRRCLARSNALEEVLDMQIRCPAEAFFRPLLECGCLFGSLPEYAIVFATD